MNLAGDELRSRHAGDLADERGHYAGVTSGRRERKATSSTLTEILHATARVDDASAAGAGATSTGARHHAPIQATASALDPTCTCMPVCRCSIKNFAA